MHRTIEAPIQGLMHQANAHLGQWFRYVPGALAALRQTPLANLPMSPQYLVYGQHPVVPAQLVLGTGSALEVTHEDHNELERIGKLASPEPNIPEMEAESQKEPDGGQKQPCESPMMSQGSDNEETARSLPPKRPSFLHTLAD